jgi:chromosome segregation ATPase
MEPLTAVTTALGGIKTAKDLTSSLRERLKRQDIKLDEVQARIIEILDIIQDSQSGLIDAKQALVDLSEELLTVKRELSDLKQANALATSVVFRHGVYWREILKDIQDIAGETVKINQLDGPYCPLCLGLYRENG